MGLYFISGFYAFTGDFLNLPAILLILYQYGSFSAKWSK